ncbi:unnamed protein product [Dovyalis caffra]|uniref:Uncharacterized protein n=1 Tax=Dovyalis caffra TaxID=77055 RepID=A0AAV1REQ6_9ROSI|nr:unnamed protein product [Dovyalis caffra]
MKVVRRSVGAQPGTSRGCAMLGRVGALEMGGACVVAKAMRLLARSRLVAWATWGLKAMFMGRRGMYRGCVMVLGRVMRQHARGTKPAKLVTLAPTKPAHIKHRSHKFRLCSYNAKAE